MLKNLKEKCAVFGIWADPLAAEMSYLGLYAQQHRGQEGAGIVSLTSDGKHIIKKGLGLVGDVFNPDKISELKGQSAIGHLRYATYGRKNLISDVQPLTFFSNKGPVALSHNGHFINGHKLINSFKKKGFAFQGSNDSECLLPLLAQSQEEENFVDVLKRALRKIEGAYSLVFLTENSLFAARDPYGFRPLVLGHRQFKEEDNGYEAKEDSKEECQKEKETANTEESFYGLKLFRDRSFRKSLVLASETCAFDLIGAKYKREIQPGEIFYVDKKGEHSSSLMEEGLDVRIPVLSKEKQKQEKTKEGEKNVSKATNSFQISQKMKKHFKFGKLQQCIFEHVYFSRPDSIVFGLNVYESRKKMGGILAQEDNVKADIVIPVPDSGLSAGLGYSQESQLPFELGITRNHYIGRSFIQSYPKIRHFSVKVKLNPHQVIKGKRIIVVDDSLVRGTTAKQMISLLRQSGAKEIHFRLSSPPIISPCHYGIDTPQKSELIASQKTLDELRDFLKVDSIRFLSLKGLLQAVSKDENFRSKKWEKKFPPEEKRKEICQSQKFCTSCFTGKYSNTQFFS